MRRVFSTPRLAEFATRQGLTTRVGRDPVWWPEVVLKELVDNALDAAETAGAAPVIEVTIDDNAIIVADQGPGIGPDVVARIFDYDRQTSSREAYVEPTRGAQGNALQTILAMPFVLDGTRGEITIESRGVRHDLAFTIDQVSLRPAIEHTRSASDVTTGTSVTVTWPEILTEVDRHLLQQLAESFDAFNPHLTITVNGAAFPASDEKWAKWRPNRPPVARWYNPGSLKRLMQAFAHDAESNGKPVPTVGAFVREFAGLSGTQKAAEIVNPLGLARANLAELLRSPGCDAVIASLRAEMECETRPVKPEALGVLGREHITVIARSYGVDEDARLEYAKQTFEANGLPFVVEVAFAYLGRDRTEDGVPLRRLLVTGLNFSPALNDPFRNLSGAQYCGQNLATLLAEQRAGRDDPVFVLVHAASPRFTFVDKGKTAVSLPSTIAHGLGEMVVKATDRWKRQKTAEIRQADAEQRRRETMVKTDKPMTIKDAAYQVMAEAYEHAAGDIGMANARQVMYAARPLILQLTGRPRFDDAYFTQTLLPDYQRENLRETESWDVVYDDRGHFAEPHTGKMIGLGTLAVRGYLEDCRSPSVVEVSVVSASVSTFGPKARYRSALFVEKEGFLPILQRSRIAERFDVALMSTKGMSVVASRALIDGLAAMGVKVFVLHDFDISGFSIRKTFTESGRRHEFKNALDYVDIGLRLDDVERLGLESEPVALNTGKGTLRQRLASTTERLRINGATEAEIAFLLSGASGEQGAIGKRVELNAMTSDQFVAFVAGKLAEHGADKVVPDGETLAKAFRAFVRSETAQRRLAEELERVKDQTVEVPADIAERVRRRLAANPALTWDEVLRSLARPRKVPDAAE